MQETLHIKRTQRMYQERNKLNYGRTSGCAQSFPVMMPKMCGCRRTTFSTSPVMRLFHAYFIIFIVMHTQSQYIAWQFLCCLAGKRFANSQADIAPASRPLLERDSLS